MDTNLIQVKGNEIFTASRLIAEKFNKEHKNVIRSIQGLIREIDQLKIEPIYSTENFNPIGEFITDIVNNKPTGSLKYFYPKSYKDSYGRSQNEYLVNRDGFTLLAMGFTGSEALKWKLRYIEAFNEMERRLKTPTLSEDNKLEIAKLLAKATRASVEAIKELYPEYFTQDIKRGSFEHLIEENTSYRKWIEDYNITKDWLGDFPTTDIYNDYIKYCKENRLIGLGKKTFFAILEEDFNLIKKQCTNGRRYFVSA